MRPFPLSRRPATFRSGRSLSSTFSSSISLLIFFLNLKGILAVTKAEVAEVA